MKVKLNVVNGSYYLLIKKELKELLGIDKEINLELENNKLIISNTEEDK